MNIRLWLIVFVLIAITGCKDPREKTVWDYIDSKLANEWEFQCGVEALHKDLIKSGYMEEHSCGLLGCANAYQGTYADIERVHHLLNNTDKKELEVLSEEFVTTQVGKEIATDDFTEFNQYSNSYFCLRYPLSWQIVQEGNQVTANTSIAVQIMEKRKNDVDFRPNINIIVSNKKWEENTSNLALQTSQNNKQIIPSYRQLGISNTQVGGCKGSLVEAIFDLQGHTLRSTQYIVKKADNTTFIITATTDNRKHKEQMKVINDMLKSIQIK